MKSLLSEWWIIPLGIVLPFVPAVGHQVVHAFSSTPKMSVVQVSSGSWSDRNSRKRVLPKTSYQLSVAGFRGQRLPVRNRSTWDSRYACPDENMTLTAVTPQMDDTDKPYSAFRTYTPTYLTTPSGHRTFWVHIAGVPSGRGFFSLQNMDISIPLIERQVYETEFVFNGETGIVGIQLPADMLPLESNALYVWSVAISCDSIDRRRYLSTRNAVTVMPEMALPPRTEQLEFFMDKGIWYDTLSFMAEDLYANLSDEALASRFTALLESVGLSEIANAPIVQLIEGE